MIQFDTQLLMKSNAEQPVPVFNWFGKKILIVEDDYVNYLFFNEILSCANACLIRAVSFQEAFDMLTSGTHFDLMIVNTGLSGNENCRSLKRFKMLWPQLYIIAISGCTRSENGKKCSASGCDTLISNNIGSYDMRSVVNELFFPVN